jgi:hypothetical protein
MTGAEISSIIISIATLVTACGGVAVGLRNSRRISVNSDRIELVRQATNGMKDALVKVTGEAKFAEGVTQGEEHPRQHRNNHHEPGKQK